MNKAIITVVGQDTVGIIARVCTYLSEHQVNVLDISQTIIDGFFNMMMIVDGSGANVSFDEMSSGLDEIGAGIGVLLLGGGGNDLLMISCACLLYTSPSPRDCS